MQTKKQTEKFKLWVPFRRTKLPNLKVRSSLFNEWTNTAPMGAAEPFQLHLSVQILAEDCSFLRSKTKGKNTKGKMATACLWSTLIATWAGPLLYSPLEVSRVPPAECWLQATGQEPSKCKWGHFFLHIISFLCIPFIQPQTPYFISFDLTKDIPKDKGLCKLACWGKLFVVLLRGLYKNIIIQSI